MAEQQPQDDVGLRCIICLEDDVKPADAVRLDTCQHVLCHACLHAYLASEITAGRTLVCCPDTACRAELSVSLIRTVDAALFDKFDRFSLARYLRTNAAVRQCPGVGCDYAVEVVPSTMARLSNWVTSTVSNALGNGGGANFRCNSDKDAKLKCLNPACGIEFCYYCQMPWHPGLTCEEHRLVVEGTGITAAAAAAASSAASSSAPQEMETRTEEDTLDVKPCPRCHALIDKIHDGTCNHVHCTQCGTGFCWLCLREVNELHFFGPSGCTFFAKKQWSTGKTLAVRAGVALLATPTIALAAAVGGPALMVYMPVKIGRSIVRHNEGGRRKALLSTALPAAIVSAPVVAAAAVALGVPALLILTYGVLPGYLIHEKLVNLKNRRRLGLKQAAAPAIAPAPSDIEIAAADPAAPA